MTSVEHVIMRNVHKNHSSKRALKKRGFYDRLYGVSQSAHGRCLFLLYTLMAVRYTVFAFHYEKSI